MAELPHSNPRQFRSAEEVWQVIESVIQELDCSDRCVEYAIDGTVHSYDHVRAWLCDAIAAGGGIHYSIDPDHLGLVRVDFARTDARAAP